jgi:predicted DsbA family dithiol-disulfide isomerase
VSGWHTAEETTLPPQVPTYWVPGKVTIVEAVDFQCPHCRQLHRLMRQFLRDQGEGIRLVRVMAPMAKNPHARDAARAYLCAKAQGKGEEMAQALFAVDDLSPESCERLAVSLGLSQKEFRACVADEQIDRQLDANLAWVMPVAPRGLPCVWVQDRRLTGEIKYDVLRDAVVAAELSKHNKQP